MKTVLVMVGLPACGKTTFIENTKTENTFVYSTDDYIEAMAKLAGQTYDEAFQESIGEATDFCEDGLKEAIAEGRDVIWDQTNLSVKKRKNILSRFPKDWEVRCIAIRAPDGIKENQEWQRRLQAREGKTIPARIMENMRNSYVLPTASEGFKWVLVYDLNGMVV